jgi:hypothetical protein
MERGGLKSEFGSAPSFLVLAKRRGKEIAVAFDRSIRRREFLNRMPRIFAEPLIVVRMAKK